VYPQPEFHIPRRVVLPVIRPNVLGLVIDKAGLAITA